MFSAYMLDPEHGWIGTHRLPLETCIRACKEYRVRTAGGLVAIVPDHADPEPYFDLVKMASRGLSRHAARVPGRRHLRSVA